MKRTVALMSALVALFAFTGLVFAMGAAADSNKTAMTGATSAKAAPAAHMHVISGKVVSVDAVANSIVIKGKKSDLTLNVAPDAKVKVGKETKLADLKAGTMVKISYKMEGEQKVATKIW